MHRNWTSDQKIKIAAALIHSMKEWFPKDGVDDKYILKYTELEEPKTMGEAQEVAQTFIAHIIAQQTQKILEYL
jgi:non-homologous end joining protein Ku